MVRNGCIIYFELVYRRFNLVSIRRDGVFVGQTLGFPNGLEIQLKDYKINSLSRGKEAIGRVSIRIDYFLRFAVLSPMEERPIKQGFNPNDNDKIMPFQ